jgi:hypothetical protein
LLAGKVASGVDVKDRVAVVVVVGEADRVPV